ncbi:MAG: hypothetical protein IJM68_00985 [Synergistaceae bacterium]|nr:hypothetical protein [Synergistaceae bacterium]
MTKLYDLCVATRRYTDKEGNEKSAYENIGAILEKEEGKPYMMLKAHFNPAGITRKEGSESIMVSMFRPKDGNGDYVSFCWTTFKGRKLYDLCVGTRKYTKDGQDKTMWENIGVIISSDKSPYMMLKAHFNPAGITRKDGSESILVSLFKPKSKQNNSSGNDFQDFGSSFSGGFDDTAPYQQDFNPQPFNPDDMPPF